MKKICLLMCLISMFFEVTCFAQSANSASLRNQSPSQIVNDIQKTDQNIESTFERKLKQDARLNNNTNRKYPIYQWIQILKDTITPYIDMLIYFGLAIGTILIIRQWTLLVVSKWADDMELKKTRTRLINIALWIGLMVWVFIIIKLLLWLSSVALGI